MTHAPSATPLAESFAPADRAAWLVLVDKTLKGADLETLTSHAAGLEILPLYSGVANQPDFAPAPRGGDQSWDVRTLVSHPAPAQAHDALAADLAGGAASALVRIDPTGEAGVAIGSAEALAGVLDGVLLDIAPIALDAGYLGVRAADWLGAAAKASPAAPLALHLDPLSALALTGGSPGPIESHVIAAANVAARLAPTYPRASLFLASGRVAHEAGAAPAAELAFALASALAYAKALVRAGLTMERALGAIVLGLAVDADPLISIAKLRAARRLWARLTAACGEPRVAIIEARSSARMITGADPWTNLVRLTAAGFAGAVGGADALVLGAFTDALGRPTAFARRMARNTQLILMEEAHVGAVADPAAGAGAFEALSDDLARAAWTQFNEIEAAGGIVTALREGLIARTVAADRKALGAAIFDRTIKIVGVTDFRRDEARAAQTDNTPRVGVEAPDPRLPGPDSHCPALAPLTIESLAA